jgi:hypothetical protein
MITKKAAGKPKINASPTTPIRNARGDPYPSAIGFRVG